MLTNSNQHLESFLTLFEGTSRLIEVMATSSLAPVESTVWMRQDSGNEHLRSKA